MKNQSFFLSILIGLSLCIPASRVLAYGECDQYGVMAQYNYDGTCSCISGWIFQNTVFGKQCVSTSQYCRDKIGFMSTYNSLYDRCECMSGYVLKTDVLGNPSCVSGNSACHDQLGIHSSYQSFSNKCVCDSGYTIVSGQCVDLDDQCVDQLGFNSSYNILYDICECDSGYIIDDGQCKNADSVCRSEHGTYSSYNSLTKKCECDDDYTQDDSGECVETQHNVYFDVIELDDDNNEVVIRSDDDGSYYHVSYGLGCLSFWRYEDKQIVVNLGTDYSLDTWDKIVLQDNDQTCNIVTKEKVDSSFSLSEEDDSGSYYIPDSGDIFGKDIASSPYKQAIAQLKEKGIIGGYPDGTYKPKNTINRAEFIKIVVGAVGTPSSGSNCYSDVKDEWFAGYACAAKNQEFATGYADGTFKPTNNINVAEALKIVLKAFVIPVRGSDQGEEWFKPFVEVATSNNIYVPTFDSPGKQITREEMAELVNRVLNYQASLTR